MTTRPGDAAVTVQHITTSDGVGLALHRLGSRTATPVLLVPGTFSNGTFWLGTRGTGFARALVAAGFEACVLDLRGHGDSQPYTPGRRWNFDDWGRLDIAAAVRTLAAEGRRPLLVGHSAGGLSMLAALAAEPEVRAVTSAVVIAAAPLPWLQRWRFPSAHALRFAAARMSVLPAPLHRFPARLLRLGPEDELPLAMHQWLDWHIRREWTANDGTDYTTALQIVDLPVLTLAGAGERRYAPPHAVQALYDLIGSARKELVVAGTATGFSRDFGHADLIVSREARAEVWPLMLRWLRRHAG
jgi:predicted alpha/beta hydrolase